MRCWAWYLVHLCEGVGDLLQMNLIQLATQPASAVVLENLFTALKLV